LTQNSEKVVEFTCDRRLMNKKTSCLSHR